MNDTHTDPSVEFQKNSTHESFCENDTRELLSEAHIDFLRHQIELEELKAERALRCWCESKGFTHESIHAD